MYTGLGNRGVDPHLLSWWRRAAGTGNSVERSRRLMPHVGWLFDLHLGPHVPMSDRQLGERWRAVLAGTGRDRHVD